MKPYPKQFRDQVEKLVQLGDSGLLEVARESGISVDSVRRWVKQSERDQGSRQDGPRGSERKGWCARGGRTVGCGWSGKSCQRPFEFVKANQALYPIASMYRVLSVSPNDYCKFDCRELAGRKVGPSGCRWADRRAREPSQHRGD